MDLNDALKEIEECLLNSSDKKLLLLCNEFFPDEDFGTHPNSGIIDDMYNLVLDEASINNEKAQEIYYFLLDEKITIDEDDFYTEEEIDHGR